MYIYSYYTPSPLFYKLHSISISLFAICISRYKKKVSISHSEKNNGNKTNSIEMIEDLGPKKYANKVRMGYN